MSEKEKAREERGHENEKNEGKMSLRGNEN